MKRLAVAGVIGVLAFAGVALATSTKHYSGKAVFPDCGAAPNVTCDVSFTGTIKNGKVTTVSAFVYDGIPMACDDGNHAVGNGPNPLPDMKVNTKRKFSGHFHTVSPPVQHIDVTGRFSKDYKKASGKLRVYGNFGGPATNCDTGTGSLLGQALIA